MSTSTLSLTQLNEIKKEVSQSLTKIFGRLCKFSTFEVTTENLYDGGVVIKMSAKGILSNQPIPPSAPPPKEHMPALNLNADKEETNG